MGSAFPMNMRQSVAGRTVGGICQPSRLHEKAEDGRVYVWMDATQDAEQTTQDTTQDAAQDERFEDLKEQLGYLRRELDEEREARRRADTIIAQLARAYEDRRRFQKHLKVRALARLSPRDDIVTAS
jgi:hypothetical protein